MREDAAAQVDQEALADPGGKNFVTEGDQAAEKRQGEIGESDLRELTEVSRDKDLVHQQFVQPDGGCIERRSESDEEEEERQPAAIRARVWPEATEDVAQRHGWRGADGLLLVVWLSEP